MQSEVKFKIYQLVIDSPKLNLIPLLLDYDSENKGITKSCSCPKTFFEFDIGMHLAKINLIDNCIGSIKKPGFFFQNGILIPDYHIKNA